MPRRESYSAAFGLDGLADGTSCVAAVFSATMSPSNASGSAGPLEVIRLFPTALLFLVVFAGVDDLAMDGSHNEMRRIDKRVAGSLDQRQTVYVTVRGLRWLSRSRQFAAARSASVLRRVPKPVKW
jgi:hypothetical protein